MRSKNGSLRSISRASPLCIYRDLRTTAKLPPLDSMDEERMCSAEVASDRAS
jgi:hypothetical protein